MITLNQIKAPPCFTGIQREQNPNKETIPTLKQLNADTVSFKGWFSSKPAGPKHVTKEAYELVTKYIENNSNNDTARKAVNFIKKIKSICEEGWLLNLNENAYCAAKKVEQEKIKEVGDILLKVKSSVLPSSSDKGVIIQSMDYYKSLLGKSSS